MVMLRVGTAPCSCALHEGSPEMIAVTGGPGAGKTAVLDLASQTFCKHVAILPEAASVLFGGGFPRHTSMAGHQAAQRAIYHVQRELERLVLEESQVRYVLCDRGTVDAWAYWRGDRDGFWEELHSSLEAEFSRYVAVLHLHTPGAESGYNHQNVLRTETPDQALALDQRVFDAWSAHPHRDAVESMDCFEEKAGVALGKLRDWMRLG